MVFKTPAHNGREKDGGEKYWERRLGGRRMGERRMGGRRMVRLSVRRSAVLMQPPATMWSVTPPQSEIMGSVNEQHGLVMCSLARTVHDTRRQRAVGRFSYLLYILSE